MLRKNLNEAGLIHETSQQLGPCHRPFSWWVQSNGIRTSNSYGKCPKGAKESGNRMSPRVGEGEMSLHRAVDSS